MRFRAAYAYRSDGAWLENAVLDVEASSGRIRELRAANPAESLGDAIDLGDAMILPGLLNAHCHLEYSAFKGKLRGDIGRILLPLRPRRGRNRSRQGSIVAGGERSEPPEVANDNRSDPEGVEQLFSFGEREQDAPGDIPFTDWIREIVRLKTETPRDDLLAALPAALAELSASGVTTLVDNLSLDLTAGVVREAPLRGLMLFECLDFMPENAERAFAHLLERMAQVGERTPGETGFAPHAPHSVSPDLLKRIVREAETGKRTLSIHAAETPEEIDFFLRGIGPLAEMKREFGTLPANWVCPRMSPIRYLAEGGALNERTLLIHATHPQPGDIELIAQAGAAVVYCPGAHRFFQRGPYPLANYLRAGIDVCIGTDSLASNAALDMVRELRLARKAHPEISAPTLVDTVTRCPARALGLDDRGVLEPGKLADLSIWQWPYRNLEEWLEDDRPCCLGVYLGGIKAHPLNNT